MNLEEKLHDRNIKPTAMRLLVLEALENAPMAMSLNDIELMFEKADKSTIYRTLKTFEKNKLIHSIEDGSGQVKYALCPESCECELNDLHYHFHCKKCKSTYCLSSQHIPKIELPINFELEEANMVLKGVCASCQ